MNLLFSICFTILVLVISFVIMPLFAILGLYLLGVPVYFSWASWLGMVILFVTVGGIKITVR